MTSPHMQAAIYAAAHRMLLDEPPCEHLCGCSDLPLDQAKYAIEGALPQIREMIAQEIESLPTVPYSFPGGQVTRMIQRATAARVARGERS